MNNLGVAATAFAAGVATTLALLRVAVAYLDKVRRKEDR